MTTYRGLTWDHPRGRVALEAAASKLEDAGASTRLNWGVHSLSGFESTPIAELADQYDLIVLDHPHLGDALLHDSIRPLDTLFERAELDAWAGDSIGSAWQSYVVDDRAWALPLDAATQVAALQPGRVEHAPETWAEVDALADSVPVALSLAGPHAFLTFSSLCVALGEEPATASDGYISELRGLVALETMRRIARRAPSGSHLLDPIDMLASMAGAGPIAYCPLVYGYVNYSGRGVAFADAPSDRPGGRRGSTIGGTGLAFTYRSEPNAALLDHARWLMSDSAQRRFIPQHDGQPSTRAAWSDDSVNADSADFYRATRSTIEQSWRRPRYAGFVGFQVAASQLVRSVVVDGRPAREGLRDIQNLHNQHVTAQKGPIS